MKTYKIAVPAQTKPSIFAFRGNSQGDASASNDLNDYLTSGGWMGITKEFRDIASLTQEAIDARVAQLTEEWKPSPGGIMEVTIMPNPFDNPTYSKDKPAIESCEFTILDFSDKKII